MNSYIFQQYQRNEVMFTERTMTYNNSPLLLGYMFQDSQWVPENTNSTKPSIYIITVSSYTHTYNKVQFIN